MRTPLATFLSVLPVLLLGPAVSGCSAPPQAPLPDGSQRVAVNRPEAIARYRAALAPAGRTAPSADDAQRSASPAQLPPGRGRPAPAPSITAVCRAATIPGVRVECQDHGLLFRIPAPVGRAAFAPGAELATLLLKAAALSPRIEIRGRTDADRADPLNRRLAAQRAVNARQYLVEHGIAPATIRTGFLAAGDHVADNSTPAGQANNRRVDIELQGLTPADMAQIAGALREDAR